MQRESFHVRVTVSGMVVVCLAMLAWAVTPAMAGNMWQGVGDWTDDASSYWSDGVVPTGTSSAKLTSGTVSINGESALAQYLYIGHRDAGYTAGDITLNMSSGSLTANRDAYFVGYDNPTMTWNLSGGTANIGAEEYLGYRHLYMTYDNEGSGSNTSALLNMTGGNLNISGNLVFADEKGATTPAAITRTAHVQLNGGTLTANAITGCATYNTTQIGGKTGGGTLSMDMTGGTLILNDRIESMGFVTAYGGTGSFLYDYTSIPGKTVITTSTAPLPPPPTAPASLGTLSVTLGSPTTLTTAGSPTQINTDSITSSRTGVAAVFYPQGPTEIRKMRVSTDYGVTWGPEINPPNHQGGAQEIGLQDGGVLKLRSDTVVAGGGYYNLETFKMNDDFSSTGGTVDYSQFTATLYLPNHMDSLDVREPGLSKGPIVQVPADYSGSEVNPGDLLMPMYAGLTGDSPTVHRAYLARSTDEGLTWNYYASMAYDGVDPNPELPGQYAGYCEPTVAILPGGTGDKMIAVMRTQLTHWGPEYRPLYVAWSEDMGKTWSTPIPANVDPGESHDYLNTISPTLAVLDNGVIAVSYGRPGFHIAFSADQGHTWGDLVHLSELGTATDDPDDIEITGQFDMVKAGPNKLVAVGSDNGGLLKVWPITVDLPTPPLYGDFDEDGDVDGVDFARWQASYPMSSGATRLEGDADGDGDVDGVDFGLWQADYPTAYPGAVAGGATIPEPASLALMILGGLALFRRRFK